MELEHLPLQYRLIQSVSEYLFNSSEASCAVLVSKTPYLSALVACSGARTVIMPPFSVGDCLLLPLEKPDIYVHVVIDRYCEEINGQLICYLKYSKNNSNKNRKITTIELDKGVKGKPNKFVEEKGFLFPTQCEDNWLGKHDVSETELKDHLNNMYPAIIGQESKVNYWKNMQLKITYNPTLTMADFLKISKGDNKFDGFYVFSAKSKKRKKHVNQIWVNAVPDDVSTGKYLIILSPCYGLFEERALEINQMYSDAKLTAIKKNDLPQPLLNLGISNRSLATVALFKRSHS